MTHHRVEPTTYSTTEVAKMIGASYRQLDYWCRTGRIPGQPPGRATGSGNRRRWSEDDLARARVLMRASRYLNLDAAAALFGTEAV